MYAYFIKCQNRNMCMLAMLYIQYYLYVLLVINMYNEFSDLNLHVGETIWTIKNG